MAAGAVEPAAGAAVLELVVATEVATATVMVMLAATAMVMLVVMLVVTALVTVLVMVLVMVAVTAAAMVRVLLPTTTTAGQPTWSAPVAGQRSRHLVANIGPAPRRDASPPRRLETLIRAAE